MVLGVLVALLLEALGKGMRLVVSASLIIAWAMPALTATIVWQWMFDTEYGLVNWALDRQGESWWADQLTFFMIATIIVVWMGIPFIAFTVVRRAHPDPGRASSRRPGSTAPASATSSATSSFPAVKPILLILTSLSVIWDFRVFTQIYVLQKAGGITRDTNLLGVYAYRISIGENRFDIGAAVAVVMVLITVRPDGGLPARDAAPGGAVSTREHAAAGSGSRSTPPARSSPSSPCSPCTGWCSRRSSATASCRTLTHRSCRRTRR